MNERIINAAPGPNTTRENLVLVRQIEAIRVALRLFDRQLEATAKEALESTSRTVSFDVPRRRFLEELTSICEGHRYEKIRKEAMKFKPQKGRESSVNGDTSSSFRSRQKYDGSESEAEAKKTGKPKQTLRKLPSSLHLTALNCWSTAKQLMFDFFMKKNEVHCWTPSNRSERVQSRQHRNRKRSTY